MPCLFLGVREALVHFFPVDDVPPGSEVFGAAVVVLEVISVLPDVVAEDGIKAVGEGRILVGLGDDFELATLVDEEAPARAELFGGGFVELLLEILEAAKVGLDLVGDGAFGLAAAFGLHDLPEHGVVHVAAAVIADDAANIFGNAGEIGNELLRRLLAEFRMLFNSAVEVGDVGLMVLIVMQLHGRLVDGRLESGVVVRKGRKFEGHGRYSFIVLCLAVCAKLRIRTQTLLLDAQGWPGGAAWMRIAHS